MQKFLKVSIQCLSTVLICAVVCSGCFVRNCPKGGKRSMEDVPEIPSGRECLSCGPRGLGQCVGPSICCGPLIGCYFNTREAHICQKENTIATPCELQGKPCGDGGMGHCVADGTCCTDETCTLDKQCEQTSSSFLRTNKRRLGPDLLTFIKRLIDTDRSRRRR